jgi:hypothetical protein
MCAKANSAGEKNVAQSNVQVEEMWCPVCRSSAFWPLIVLIVFLVVVSFIHLWAWIAIICAKLQYFMSGHIPNPSILAILLSLTQSAHGVVLLW